MVTKETRDKLAAFAAERNWQKSHTPENLAKSISIEAAELLECYQWGPDAVDMQHVKDELADVLTYCLHLAEKIGADPDQIILEKLESTRIKYPVPKEEGGNSGKEGELKESDGKEDVSKEGKA